MWNVECGIRNVECGMNVRRFAARILKCMYLNVSFHNRNLLEATLSFNAQEFKFVKKIEIRAEGATLIPHS